MTPLATPWKPALSRRACVAGLAGIAIRPVHAACERVCIPLVPGGLLVQEAQGRAEGALVSLIAALQRRLGCPVETPLLPQGRLIRAFYETFEADVLIPGSPLPFDGHTPHFVPLYQVLAHRLCRADRGWTAAQRDAIWAQGAQCVLPRHVSYGPGYDALVQRMEGQGRVTWVRDVGTALRMVLAGRVDFALSSPTVAYAYLGAQSYAALRLDALPGLRPLETGAAVSRRSLTPAAQEAVLVGLRGLVREGEVQQAFARHFPAAVLAREPLALPPA